MRQIRARIREKRGADYTEQELRSSRPSSWRSFSIRAASGRIWSISSNGRTSSRPPEVRVRRHDALRIHRRRAALHPQVAASDPEAVLQPESADSRPAHAEAGQRRVPQAFRREDPLYYEVVHNLVMEITRLGIEVHNLKMRVESMSSRMDFDERRARSLESVVQYRQPGSRRAAAAAGAVAGGGRRSATRRCRPTKRSGAPRRRRRRGRRRPGATGPGPVAAIGGDAPGRGRTRRPGRARRRRVVRAAAGTRRTAEPPISEARGRGSALRRGYQRRRRTSRSIHR